jgi:hypothetical protein
MRIMLLAIAVGLLVHVGAIAQKKPVVRTQTVQNQQIPNIQAPPGYTTKVEKVTKSYNYWGLKREIPLPWDRIVMQSAEIPAGVKLSDNSVSPSKDAMALFADPASKLRGVGAPARSLAQHFKGKNKRDEGTILYIEWSKKLPADMREQLARLFYKKDVRPDGPQTVEFIVNENTLIIWAFKNHESAVKQAHQEKIFNLVSEIANKMFPPTPPANAGAPGK